MSFFYKKFRWALLYAFLLSAFTLYVVLDSFVIQRVYTVVQAEEGGESELVESGTGSNRSAAQGDNSSNTSAAQENTESEAANGQTANDTNIISSEDAGASDTGTDTNSVFTQSAVVTDNSYSDENISITITEYREQNTSIYVADVYVSSAEYLQTAFAEQSYGRNITEKTSEIAAQNNAVLAINGDYYGAQKKGYVLKNGVLYRETSATDQEDLVIWQDGSFEIITEGEISASQLLADGAQQILSFGPALVTEGNIAVTEGEEVGKSKASNPRTAIGIIDDLHYVFVVSDGRTDESEGLTLYQLASFMQELGAETAYNLDGGGSSTMYFNGTVINTPTTNGDRIKERSVSDIVYIG